MPGANDCTHDGKQDDVVTRVDHEQAQWALFEQISNAVSGSNETDTNHEPRMNAT